MNNFKKLLGNITKKTNLKTVSVFLFSFSLLLFSTSVIAGEKQKSKSPTSKVIHFKAAHGPYQVVLKPLTVFKEEVEKLTQGRIKVELSIPENAKDTNQAAVTKTFNDVVSGKIEMSQLYTSYMSNYEKDFLALEIPFILKDHQHAFEVVDGDIGKSLLAKLESQSPIKGLGFTYCGGYRMIGSKRVKINTVEDFAGLKINAESKMSRSALAELGAINIPTIKKESVLAALEKNDVDAYVSVYPRYFHGNEYKTAKIANALDFNTQFTVLVINKKFFSTLSKKDQEIVAFAAQKASAKERQLAVEVAEDVIKNASQHGIEVVTMSADEKARLVKKMDNVDWAKKHGFSSEIVEKIRSLAKPKMTYSKSN